MKKILFCLLLLPCLVQAQRLTVDSIRLKAQGETPSKWVSVNTFGAVDTVSEIQTLFNHQQNDLKTVDTTTRTKVLTRKATDSLINYALTGTVDTKGDWDASGNTLPSTSVKTGDKWTISVKGFVSPDSFYVGDVIIAKIDDPGQTVTNWNHIYANQPKSVNLVSAGSSQVGALMYNGRVAKSGAIHGGFNPPIFNDTSFFNFNGTLRATNLMANGKRTIIPSYGIYRTYLSDSTGEPIISIPTHYWTGSVYNPSTGVFIGYRAGYYNIGGYPIAIGPFSGYMNSGASITAVGYNSAKSNTGNYITAFGTSSLQGNTGSANTAIGYHTLNNSVSGGFNTALGHGAGSKTKEGACNIYIGYETGNRYGTSNVVLGQGGLFAPTNSNASYNTNIGALSGTSLKGSLNTIIGFAAARDLDMAGVSSDRNIIIGSYAYQNKKNSIHGQLIIDNNSTDTLNNFIRGDMLSDTLRINATTRIGKGLNNFQVEADGTIVLNGDATVWEDLQFPLTSAKLTGTSDPAFSKFRDNGSGSTGIYNYLFSATATNEVFTGGEMSHTYKEGTDEVIHLHFYPATADTGRIVFQVEYVVNNIDGIAPNSTVVTYIYTITTNTQMVHKVIDIATITGTGLKISHEIGIRIARLGGDSRDTYPGGVFITRAAIHYERDMLGSRTITTK